MLLESARLLFNLALCQELVGFGEQACQWITLLAFSLPEERVEIFKLAFVGILWIRKLLDQVQLRILTGLLSLFSPHRAILFGSLLLLCLAALLRD